MREQVARFSADSFDQALAEDRPLYTVHRSTQAVRVALWERLVLPAVTRDGRRFRRIDVPGATGTAVWKTNARGQIVGTYTHKRDVAAQFAGAIFDAIV